MFSAVTEDGQMFHLLGAQQSRKLKQRRFFCPVCGGELAVKLGLQKRRTSPIDRTNPVR